MGNCEEAKDCKPEETSSPPATCHVYTDWASMQAYYGPRMAVPPYFSSPVASGHAPPPYMWGPMPHMMPPYAAIYPHGGVYAHPGVTVAGNPNPTLVPIDSCAKSSGNPDRGLIKKLKGIDELTMSIGNNNGISNSRDTEGSSEGSDGNTSCKNGHKRIRGGSSTSSEGGKTERSDANGVSKKVTGVKILGKEVGAVISGDSGTELELKKSPASANMAMVPNSLVLQNERELKREKRKQSNRESARRSRLRKQAEAEELGTRVEALTSENLKLKSEINQLTVNATNLKLQNAKLLEKLKKATEGPRADKKGSSLSTANLLSRVDNRSGSVVGEATSSGSGAPLHQLLDASPRADGVAAGAG
ncbi:putative transcription factor bZIP family [Helianthus annuus]|uniref:common plant regulatory factor 1 isoform X2 n=1 Tax=Helianthus annuus TaxID=4232 RepID=UPI000B8F9715|nr:common plant regulatory factor 1 isoform X2 [Helianthus annuus]KAJ0430397.1 putative transcription factor bZIP family [Helianthus annuus]KAJ0448813.1 putative transcription factor bZIP family [Helianthus annuus]KAJ0633693.1 putative transcription factor bZIP family [Helianthus annuus]